MHYCHLTQNSDKLEPFDSIKFIQQSAENLPKCATLIHLLKTRRNLGLSQLSQRILGPLMFLKAGFHQQWSRSRSCNQKRRAYDLVKTAYRFHLRLRCLRSAYDLVKTRLSESEAEAEEPNQLQSVGTCIVIGVVSGVGRKWKRSDSSDSNSVALMTPLTTPSLIFTGS